VSAARTEPAKPLRRDAQRNRERILATAKSLFAERGVETSLDDVAAAAGVGVGTVYRHYPTKDALIDELFEASISELTAFAEASLSDPDAWAAFTRFIERLAEGFAANRGLDDVLHGERGQQRIANARDRLATPTDALIERAQATGKLPADFERADIGMIHTMLAAVIRSSPADSPELWRRYFRFIVDGLAERS
jgi:AcrR family transcriptional regulator